MKLPKINFPGWLKSLAQPFVDAALDTQKLTLVGLVAKRIDQIPGIDPEEAKLAKIGIADVILDLKVKL